MSRTADYTIQGFLYQFNKTALEILSAQDDDRGKGVRVNLPQNNGYF